MKHRVSISVDEETVLRVREAVRKGLFRNKSHAFEHSVREALKDE